MYTITVELPERGDHDERALPITVPDVVAFSPLPI